MKDEAQETAENSPGNRDPSGKETTTFQINKNDSKEFISDHGKEEIQKENNSVIADSKTPSFQINEGDLKELISDHVKEEIQKEIKFDKASLFTVFGIFASIVTFVSVEIQILKTLCDFWNAIGFSIIMLASLLTFILVLDYIGRGWRNDFASEIKQFPWILTIFIVVLFAVGFYSVSRSAKEITCKDEAIFRKYTDDFADRQVEFEKTYKSTLKDLQKKIIDTNDAIRSLRNYQKPQG